MNTVFVRMWISAAAVLLSAGCNHGGSGYVASPGPDYLMRQQQEHSRQWDEYARESQMRQMQYRLWRLENPPYQPPPNLRPNPMTTWPR